MRDGFPSIVKGGFLFGGQFGDGALRSQSRTLGYYRRVSASYGLQAGLQTYGYALFLMNDSALGYLDEAAQCSDVAVADIDLPDIVHVDFAAKVLSSPDRQRTSPISAVEVLDAVLVLQGHQNGRGWTMVVERATGRLAATVTDAEGVFVIAGGCTAR